MTTRNTICREAVGWTALAGGVAGRQLYDGTGNCLAGRSGTAIGNFSTAAERVGKSRVNFKGYELLLICIRPFKSSTDFASRWSRSLAKVFLHKSSFCLHPFFVVSLWLVRYAGRVPRHFGKFKQPQKSEPRFAPRRALRLTICELQIGQ